MRNYISVAIENMLLEFKTNQLDKHQYQSLSQLKTSDKTILHQSILDESRDSKLKAFLNGKKLFVTIFLGATSSSSYNSKPHPETFFEGASCALHARMSRVKLAQLLDSLAPKFRILFCPSPRELTGDSCSEIKEVNFIDFKSDSELFHACEMSAIGL